MLLRFAVENFMSFKDAVEFNMFPSSKSQRLTHHKKQCGHAEILRMSAIYGANGAGKSALLAAISLLVGIIKSGTLPPSSTSANFKFRFDDECANRPCSFAIEFFVNEKLYYYQLEFNDQTIISETLLQSKRTCDSEIFSRNGNIMKFHADKGIGDAAQRMVRPNVPLLYYIGEFYPEIDGQITEAYLWLINKIFIVTPRDFAGTLSHWLDIEPNFMDMANKTILELGTGLSRIGVKKEILTDDLIKDNKSLREFCDMAKANPGMVFAVDNEGSCVIFENNQIYKKKLQCFHKGSEGDDVELPLFMESDGTRRIIDYLPILYAMLTNERVYIIDEIERSLHPILIKELIQKISGMQNVRGQLIFTTHESNLLDQSIFRTDEIWFAEKDSLLSTKLYSLSDFNVHATANVENGYLNGRYGAIPFLSNLKDLHWSYDTKKA